MSAEETKVVVRVMKEASKAGNRLLRNSRGQFYTLDGVRALIDAAKKLDLDGILACIKKLRQVRAGLEAEGASDLIGITPITITPEMVGMTVGVFTAAEVKKDGWTKPTDEREKQQLAFINNVNRLGGIGFFIAGHEKYDEKMSENVKKFVDIKSQTI